MTRLFFPLCAMLLPSVLLMEACGEGNVRPIDSETDTGLDDADKDGFLSDEDCNDQDPDVFPGAPELCNDGRLTDCNRKDETGAITLRDEAYTNLQEALDDANEGDEILLCPGTYPGNFTGSTPVTVRGLEGADATIIDGENNEGTTFIVRSGTTLNGLTVRGGNGTQGGGITVPDLEGELTLIDCQVRDNRAVEGAGIYVPTLMEVTLRGTQVLNNVAVASGGGLYVNSESEISLESGASITANTARTGAGVFLSSARLRGGSVIGNTATDAPPPKDSPPNLPLLTAGGSGVAAIGRCNVTGTEVRANVSIGDTGGAVMVTQEDDLTLEDVAVSENVCDNHGGGLEIRNGTIRMEGESVVFGNTSSAARGSGVLIEGGELIGGVVRNHTEGSGVLVRNGSLTNVTISDNVSLSEGGGIQARGIVTLTNVTLRNNIADIGGAVFYAREGAGADQVLQVVSSDIQRNQADVGGAIFAPTLSVQASNISQNQAGRGGAFYITRKLEVFSSVMNSNTAITPDGGGAIFYSPVNVEDYPPISITLSEVNMGITGSVNDNTPSDVTFVSLDGPEVYTTYGASTTVQCDKDNDCL